MAFDSEIISKGDTVNIEFAVYGEDGDTPASATTVTLNYRRPDGTTATVGPQAISPAGGQASFKLTDTTQIGMYHGSAQFTLTGGDLKSVARSWEVYDPLALSTTDLDKSVDLAWMMLEDCFDSEVGGPYLRDASLANFDKLKLVKLAPMALMEINMTAPRASYDITNFPFNTIGALFAKALELEGIKHLMRSYVEQPLPTGGEVTYFDRRDYLQRWQTIYQMEEEEYKHWIRLWKRGQFGFGAGAMLIDIRSGIGLLGPRYMPSRGRPWY